MKTIVITGSTRGIGYGLAEAFLARGCRVVVSGRTAEAVGEAVSKLAEKYGVEGVFGQPCDVTDYKQVQNLWDAAAMQFEKVDIWINNAGTATTMMDLWTLAPEMLSGIVETNLVGTLYGSKVAINGMLGQGHGALYNMEGAGSTGRIHAGMSTYATTKRAINYLNGALVKELGDKPVLVGGLQPGMVLTDLIEAQRVSGGEDWEQTKRIINIIGDRVENVCPWLVERILENQKQGAMIKYSSSLKIMWRFMTASFSKRDLFANEE